MGIQNCARPWGICPGSYNNLAPWFRAVYAPILLNENDGFRWDRGLDLVEDNGVKDEALKILKNIDFSRPLDTLWKGRREMIDAINPCQLVFRQVSPLTIYHAYKLPTDTPFVIFSKPYGVPYIPASSVKGVVRSYFDSLGAMMGWDKKEDGAETSDNPLKRVEDFIFGKGGETDAGRGAVIFWDAVPLWSSQQDDTKLLEIDIINNHFQGYYGQFVNKAGGGNASLIPLDANFQPNPVRFVVVKKGILWHFAFEVVKEPDEGLWEDIAALREAMKSLTCPHSELCLNTRTSVGALIESIMTWGLSNFGIGAKTRVGYGRMQKEKEFCEGGGCCA